MQPRNYFELSRIISSLLHVFPFNVALKMNRHCIPSSETKHHGNFTHSLILDRNFYKSRLGVFMVNCEMFYGFKAMVNCNIDKVF